MKKLFAVLLVVSISLTSCKDGAERDITIIHKLMYNGTPLVMLTPYEYPDGRSLTFSKISYYYSDLQISGNDKTVTLEEVDYINFADSNTSESAAASGVVKKYEKINIDIITNLSMNIGLTKEQNATTPENYKSGHPLAQSGEYWGGWKSFVFAKIEGTIDLDNDGTREQTFALHLGSDEILRKITISLNQDTNAKQPLELTMVSDIYSIFNKDGVYNIDARNNIHSKDHLTEANLLIDNWAGTMSFLQ